MRSASGRHIESSSNGSLSLGERVVEDRQRGFAWSVTRLSDCPLRINRNPMTRIFREIRPAKAPMLLRGVGAGGWGNIKLSSPAGRPPEISPGPTSGPVHQANLARKRVLTPFPSPAGNQPRTHVGSRRLGQFGPKKSPDTFSVPGSRSSRGSRITADRPEHASRVRATAARTARLSRKTTDAFHPGRTLLTCAVRQHHPTKGIWAVASASAIAVNPCAPSGSAIQS